MSDDQKTVDGVPVKVGDMVWFWIAGRIIQRNLTRTDLGYWWEHRTKPRIYSTERAAVGAALVERCYSYKRAMQDRLRAIKSIERLSARLEKIKGDRR